MGSRAGQGFGRQKPKRLRCPDCGKKGVTQPKLCVGLAAAWVRDCQYCGGSWTEAAWEIAKKTIVKPTGVVTLVRRAPEVYNVLLDGVELGEVRKFRSWFAYANPPWGRAGSGMNEPRRTRREAVDVLLTVAQASTSHPPVQPIEYPPLTPAEINALTCMQAGVPWDDNLLGGLGELFALSDALRAAGKRPIDPADLTEPVAEAFWAGVTVAERVVALPSPNPAA